MYQEGTMRKKNVISLVKEVWAVLPIALAATLLFIVADESTKRWGNALLDGVSSLVAQNEARVQDTITVVGPFSPSRILEHYGTLTPQQMQLARILQRQPTCGDVGPPKGLRDCSR